MSKYFTGSIVFTIACLCLGSLIGYQAGGIEGALSMLFTCAVLGVLEVSLSFDNAVVNATVLKNMPPVWRGRFLTFGVLIAVVGMQIVFPLLIVGVAAKLGPLDALRLAISQPAEYERIITGAHVGIAGFGGAFLAMVGLKFFFDADKEVHWIAVVEKQLSKFANVEAIEIGVVLATLFGMSQLLPHADALVFMLAGSCGLLAFIGVEALGSILGASDDQVNAVQRSGLAAFLYLELLDASFSFDGVIGSFALSNNLIIIALGLGIGAMFVRSMTVYLVDKGTLSEYRYLEHGAFWAILALAGIMLASARFHIPGVVTGVIGAVLIGVAFFASVQHNRKHPPGTDDDAHAVAEAAAA